MRKMRVMRMSWIVTKTLTPSLTTTLILTMSTKTAPKNPKKMRRMPIWMARIAKMRKKAAFL